MSYTLTPTSLAHAMKIPDHLMVKMGPSPSCSCTPRTEWTTRTPEAHGVDGIGIRADGTPNDEKSQLKEHNCMKRNGAPFSAYFVVHSAAHHPHRTADSPHNKGRKYNAVMHTHVIGLQSATAIMYLHPSPPHTLHSTHFAPFGAKPPLLVEEELTAKSTHTHFGLLLVEERIDGNTLWWHSRTRRE